MIQRSYYRGWSTAQIATDLGIAEGTVKSRLHYAVRALRLTLQELELLMTAEPRNGLPAPIREGDRREMT